MLDGKYANYFQIGENALEFVIEFGQSYADEPEPLIHTRIITSPGYAVQLLSLLHDALQQYEEQFGPIQRRQP
jgi:Protein of unknown function (DUF3467)